MATSTPVAAGPYLPHSPATPAVEAVGGEGSQRGVVSDGMLGRLQALEERVRDLLGRVAPASGPATRDGGSSTAAAMPGAGTIGVGEVLSGEKDGINRSKEQRRTGSGGNERGPGEAGHDETLEEKVNRLESLAAKGAFGGRSAKDEEAIVKSVLLQVRA